MLIGTPLLSEHRPHAKECVGAESCATAPSLAAATQENDGRRDYHTHPILLQTGLWIAYTFLDRNLTL